MALFESYERRIDQINAVLNSYGISSIEEAEKITKDAGLDVYDQVKKIQPICFENACWAYTVGAAIAIKKGCRRAADAAARGVEEVVVGGGVPEPEVEVAIGAVKGQLKGPGARIRDAVEVGFGVADAAKDRLVEDEVSGASGGALRSGR